MEKISTNYFTKQKETKILMLSLDIFQYLKKTTMVKDSYQ